MLAPFGTKFDREDAGLLEHVAQALALDPRKLCLWVSWADPQHPTLGVNGAPPRQIGEQPATVLTALYVGCGSTTLADIDAGFTNVASLGRPACRKLDTNDTRDVDNRVQKLNTLLERSFGATVKAVVSSGGRSGKRSLDPSVKLVVTDLPF